ncbi:MAG: 2-oxoglutarate carboxylase large subunit [Bacteroidetes bacterium ADurb.Bin408]|nr:MAG: 2-oxoglutarate carboxylase large subunit [Bacteroidetes bacterium ADurb.Bin408]
MEKKEKKTTDTAKKKGKSISKSSAESEKTSKKPEDVKNNTPAVEKPERLKPSGKKNPSDVEIVDPEYINDYYDFIDFNWDGTSYNTTLPKKFTTKKKYELPNPKFIKAFIPGLIQKVFVSDGDKVKKDDKLLILEAMKMKNNIMAPFAGKIKKVYVKQGQQVTKSEILIEFK